MAQRRHVPEAAPLHVFVGHLDHQLRSERLPREILVTAPAALSARHALRDLRRCPCRPRMPGQRILAVRREKLHQLFTLLLRETPDYAHVLKRALRVIQTEKE